MALPVDTPKLPRGIKGNVDTVAGMRVQLSSGSSSSAAIGGGRRRDADADRDAGVRLRADDVPRRARLRRGLYPNQILTAYGIAPLQAAGLKGQGARVAIVGEAPTPASDVNTFRTCFGAQGTSLKIHDAG